MFPLKQGGIALATVISQMCNNLLLLYFLKKENFAPRSGSIITAMLRSCTLALVAGLPMLGYDKLQNALQFIAIPDLPDLWPLLTVALLFALIYGGLSLLTKAPELNEFYQSIIVRRSCRKEK